jgi:hypothetical protein
MSIQQKEGLNLFVAPECVFRKTHSQIGMYPVQPAGNLLRTSRTETSGRRAGRFNPNRLKHETYHIIAIDASEQKKEQRLVASNATKCQVISDGNQ